MKFSGILLITCFFLLGCSSSEGLLVPDSSQEVPLAQQTERISMNWDYGLFRVSEDHASIERIPIRGSDVHVNATRFVEPPNCLDCMNIGQPSVQPDGTIKVNVTLRHPFPNDPQFTGFDVRGTIIFNATRYWEASQYEVGMVATNWVPIFPDKVHFYFSRSVDGGGELLNPDGHTLYLFPGFEVSGFSQPIFKYKKGKQAYGPDPDSTINGYRLFTHNLENRNMFLVTDTITREYHIQPPEGEFIFGYVVDASWAWPKVMPVNDPAVDFPQYANCEDGYVLGTEQLHPFKLGYWEPIDYPGTPPFTERDIYTVTSQIYQTDDDGYPSDILAHLFCPDLTNEVFNQERGVALTMGYEEIDFESKIYKNTLRIREGTYDAEPGTYTALICISIVSYIPSENYWPRMIISPLIFDFIELEVVPAD